MALAGHHERLVYQHPGPSGWGVLGAGAGFSWYQLHQQQAARAASIVPPGRYVQHYVERPSVKLETALRCKSILEAQLQAFTRKNGALIKERRWRKELVRKLRKELADGKAENERRTTFVTNILQKLKEADALAETLKADKDKQSRFTITLLEKLRGAEALLESQKVQRRNTQTLCIAYHELLEDAEARLDLTDERKTTPSSAGEPAILVTSLDEVNMDWSMGTMQTAFEAQAPTTPDCDGKTPDDASINILADRDLVEGDSLGAGGFGAVKIGVHRRTRDKYAVKRSAGEAGGDSLNRIEMAVYLRMMKDAQRNGQYHRHIIRPYGMSDAAPGMPIVLELCVGDMAKIVAGDIISTKLEQLRLCAEVCDALAYVHDLGIVHADVKFANVCIAKDCDGNMVAKLADPGLARAIGEKRGKRRGTLGFLPPENTIGSVTAHPTQDTFAMGIMVGDVILQTGLRCSNLYANEHTMTEYEGVLVAAAQGLDNERVLTDVWHRVACRQMMDCTLVEKVVVPANVDPAVPEPRKLCYLVAQAVEPEPEDRLSMIALRDGLRSVHDREVDRIVEEDEVVVVVAPEAVGAASETVTVTSGAVVAAPEAMVTSEAVMAAPKAVLAAPEAVVTASEAAMVASETVVDASEASSAGEAGGSSLPSERSVESVVRAAAESGHAEHIPDLIPFSEEEHVAGGGEASPLAPPTLAMSGLGKPEAPRIGMMTGSGSTAYASASISRAEPEKRMGGGDGAVPLTSSAVVDGEEAWQAPRPLGVEGYVAVAPITARGDGPTWKEWTGCGEAAAFSLTSELADGAGGSAVRSLRKEEDAAVACIPLPARADGGGAPIGERSETMLPLPAQPAPGGLGNSTARVSAKLLPASFPHEERDGCGEDLLSPPSVVAAAGERVCIPLPLRAMVGATPAYIPPERDESEEGQDDKTQRTDSGTNGKPLFPAPVNVANLVGPSWVEKSVAPPLEIARLMAADFPAPKVDCGQRKEFATRRVVTPTDRGIARGAANRWWERAHAYPQADMYAREEDTPMDGGSYDVAARSVTPTPNPGGGGPNNYQYSSGRGNGWTGKRRGSGEHVPAAMEENARAVRTRMAPLKRTVVTAFRYEIVAGCGSYGVVGTSAARHYEMAQATGPCFVPAARYKQVEVPLGGGQPVDLSLGYIARACPEECPQQNVYTSPCTGDTAVIPMAAHGGATSPWFSRAQEVPG